ncbi:MAG: glutamate-1-semialdehyde-2,1-aminomutase [Chloroflexi bacterium]|nr:glutamate-1-semialdehyde-2,1-aminomutase [Chloroflexota bacterium]
MNSQKLYQKAQAYLPGGVNSPVRAFRSVGGTPRFLIRGHGSHVTDADGQEYIDYVNSWGPLILGHAHLPVVRAIQQAAAAGTSFGAPNLLEIELAQRVAQAFPSMELMRFVNSGTEATMSALRLARGYTGRNRILKFDGAYHGHADALLAQAGSGLATFGLPASAGVPESVTQDTLIAPYNDLEAVATLFARLGESIAAVIVEPVAGNMGVVPPAEGFLPGLRQLTSQYGALLIFDEVITGFRLARGGAQELYGIFPDLTCLGKIVGGGLPVGAFGGRREIMELLAPLGPVYQAGTLSGNPLAMAAGMATLDALAQTPQAYSRLDELAAQLVGGWKAAAHDAGLPVTINRVGSMFTAFFTAGPVTDYASAKRSDTAVYARFFHAMLDRGIYLAPSQFEAAFLSLAHSTDDIDTTIVALQEALQSVVAAGGGTVDQGGSSQ